jgi:hypothetical protein
VARLAADLDQQDIPRLDVLNRIEDRSETLLEKRGRDRPFRAIVRDLGIKTFGLGEAKLPRHSPKKSLAIAADASL